MEVIEKTKMVEVYEVNGVEFLDKVEAVKYKERCEEELKRSYYLVECEPSGMGEVRYQEKVILGVTGDLGLSTVYQYLIDEYGDPLYILDGEVTKSYVIGERHEFNRIEDMENFFKQHESDKTNKSIIVLIDEYGKVEQELEYQVR